MCINRCRCIDEKYDNGIYCIKEEPHTNCWCEGHLKSEKHTKYNCYFCSVAKGLLDYKYFENEYQCDHISEKKEEYIKERKEACRIFSMY